MDMKTTQDFDLFSLAILVTIDAAINSYNADVPPLLSHDGSHDYALANSVYEALTKHFEANGMMLVSKRTVGLLNELLDGIHIPKDEK
jgi:hypothetical protein